MFDPHNTPLLVLPVDADKLDLFPESAGYNVHHINENQALVSFLDGWTFNMDIKQQGLISSSACLMVRNDGRITTAGSTFTKGYAHHFCQIDGQEPPCEQKHTVFPGSAHEEWLIVPGNITMIWLQYGYKNQFCGSAFEVQRYYYGNLIIRNFSIVSDYAPKLGKNALNITPASKLLHVSDNRFLIESFSEIDKDPEHHLISLLESRMLGHYQAALSLALKRASTE